MAESQLGPLNVSRKIDMIILFVDYNCSNSTWYFKQATCLCGIIVLFIDTILLYLFIAWVVDDSSYLKPVFEHVLFLSLLKMHYSLCMIIWSSSLSLSFLSGILSQTFTLFDSNAHFLSSDLVFPF